MAKPLCTWFSQDFYKNGLKIEDFWVERRSHGQNAVLEGVNNRT